MSDLTQNELRVLDAIDNEAETLTAEERANGYSAEMNAWANAATYADEYGMTIAEFRATITKVSGLDFTEVLR